MKKKSLFTVLVMAILACSVFAAGFTVSYAEQAAEPTLTTIFEFKTIGESSDPTIKFWQGEGELVDDDFNTGKKATKLKFADASWGTPPTEEWAVNSDTFNMPALTSEGAKSLCLDVYISDYTKLKTFTLKVGMGISSYDNGYIFTVSSSSVPALKNGWQTLQFDLADITVGTIAAGDVLNGVHVEGATTKQIDITLSGLYFSSELTPEPELPILDGYEFNELGEFAWNAFGNGVGGNTKDYLTQSTNEEGDENQAWKFEPGASADTLNYKLPTVGIIDKTLNAVEIKIYIEDAAKVTQFRLKFCTDIADWAGTEFNYFVDISTSKGGWLTLRAPVKTVMYAKPIVGIWMNVATTCDVKIDYFKFVHEESFVPLPVNMLDDFSNMSSVIWNGLGITLVDGETANDKAIQIASGNADPSNANINFKQPIDNTAYNAFKIRLKVDNANLVQKLDFLIVTEDSNWTGYTFDLAGKLVNGWQTVYVLFSDMTGAKSVADPLNPRFPDDDPVDGIMSMANIIVTNSTPITITGMEFTNVGELKYDAATVLSSKTAGDVDLKTWYTLQGNPAATVSYKVTMGGEEFNVNDGVFTTVAEGAYQVEITLTDGDFTQTISKNYMLDNTAPTITRTSYTALNGATINVASFFSIADALDSAPVVTYTLTKGGESVELDSNTFVAQIGKYSLTASATDNVKNSDTLTIEFEVLDNVLPTIAFKDDAIFAVGAATDLSGIITVTDNVTAAGEIVVTYVVKLGLSNITLGDGKTFTPTKGGTYTLTVTATDKAKNTATEIFALTVPDSVKPVIKGTDTVNKTAVSGDVINLAGISATDDVAIKVNLTITVKMGDTLVTLSDDKKFTAAEGTYTVTVVASDGINEETQSFNIVVSAKPNLEPTDENKGCGSLVNGSSDNFGGKVMLICGLMIALLFVALLKVKTKTDKTLTDKNERNK